jgi:hypothetical protein
MILFGITHHHNDHHSNGSRQIAFAFAFAFLLEITLKNSNLFSIEDFIQLDSWGSLYLKLELSIK